MSEAQRTIPHSIEAEQAVIASILIDPEKIREISEILSPTYFYHKANEIIFDTFLQMQREQIVIDILTVKSYLEAKKALATVGGVEYLIDLADAIPTSENAGEYAKIIHDKFVLRETIKRANDILNESYQPISAHQLIEFAEKEIFSLSKLMRSEDFLNWNDVITKSYSELIERIAQDNKKITGLSTGFVNLDSLTAGLQKSDLIILAARPSVGKTAFSLNLARNVAFKNNAHVAFFSLEMAADQLLTRMLASETKVPIQKIKLGTITQEEQQIINNGYDELSKLHFYVDDTAGIKIGDIKSKCRKLKLESGLDMILIDYLQLITTNGTIENRQQEVSFISRELKGLAKELNVPIVALSQLSRGVEQRADKRPMMSDIRESGSIEQDADIIMMLYRPEYYGANLEDGELEQMYEGKTELSLVKHRNGETGTLEFKFEKEVNRFRPIIGETYE
ncbi:MAG: replicative DNA helicase [Mycoplasmatales bacterium]